MGFRYFSSSNNDCNCNNTTIINNNNRQDGDPNPYKFKLEHVEYLDTKNGIMTIAIVWYPGCTTFNGRKLLLIKGKLEKNVEVLDPHLLNENYQVVARFQPNDMGMKMAHLSCQY